MTDIETEMRELAKLAISNGECGAQMEITDSELRRALTDAITSQLLHAYQLGEVS